MYAYYCVSKGANTPSPLTQDTDFIDSDYSSLDLVLDYGRLNLGTRLQQPRF
jgi:hypothetical protein